MTSTDGKLDAMRQDSPSQIEKATCENDCAVGQVYFTPFGLDVHNPVFLISAGSITMFVTIALFNQEASANFFGRRRPWLTGTLGWFLMLCVNFIFVFCLFIGFSKPGRVKINDANATNQSKTADH